MGPTRRSVLTGAAAIGGAVAIGASAWASAPTIVRAVTVQPSGSGARVTLAIDRQATARTFFLTAPDRFVIDVANARLALPQGASGTGPGVGIVSRYRYAQRPDGAARVVLDLEVPARVVRQDVGARLAPSLSFDLAPAAAAPLAGAPAPPEVRTPSSGRRTIVVDAGHGGRDPGAIGARGVREKDVVLDTALQLRRALESRGRYRVALTRDADRYVDLEERVRFARAQNADLFISLHADSHADSTAHGASVYTISRRGETRAQDLMDAQDWTLDLGEAPRQGVAHDILVDLYQRETTNRSAQFAQIVIPRLGAVAPLLHSSHRNADYFVLLTPDVPAVLIETGFLSNADDARRLGDPRARRALAEAMAEAVDVYFAMPTVRSGA